MRKELNRLNGSQRDKALRRALALRLENQPAGIDANKPCPWWTQRVEAEHRAWLNSPEQKPISYLELDPCKQWAPSQPVLLQSQGYQHLVFVRLSGAFFTPRWLAGDIPAKRVHPSELTTRNPRQLWANSYELQLAFAITASSTSQSCAWLKGPFNPETEPELEALYELASQELERPRSIPGPEPAASFSVEPRAQRAWTRAEHEAMYRQSAGLDGVIEAIAV